MKRYRWDAIIDRVDKSNPITIAEIGVWKGGLSRKLLEALPLMTLIQVDRWKAYTEAENVAEGNTKMSRQPQQIFDFARLENHRNTYLYGNRINVLEYDSVTASNCITDGICDLVFIDAAHSYEGCKSDILAWIPKVKPGGWIGGHDYLRVDVNKAVRENFEDNKVEADSNKTWFVRV